MSERLNIGTRVLVSPDCPDMPGQTAYIIDTSADDEYPYMIGPSVRTQAVAKCHWVRARDIKPAE